MTGALHIVPIQGCHGLSQDLKYGVDGWSVTSRPYLPIPRLDPLACESFSNHGRSMSLQIQELSGSLGPYPALRGLFSLAVLPSVWNERARCDCSSYGGGV